MVDNGRQEQINYKNNAALKEKESDIADNKKKDEIRKSAKKYAEYLQIQSVKDKKK